MNRRLEDSKEGIVVIIKVISKSLWFSQHMTLTKKKNLIQVIVHLSSFMNIHNVFRVSSFSERIIVPFQDQNAHLICVRRWWLCHYLALSASSLLQHVWYKGHAHPSNATLCKQTSFIPPRCLLIIIVPIRSFSKGAVWFQGSGRK